MMAISRPNDMGEVLLTCLEGVVCVVIATDVWLGYQGERKRQATKDAKEMFRIELCLDVMCRRVERFGMTEGVAPKAFVQAVMRRHVQGERV